MPEISVIVCSYNHAKWIERCIRSLTHQDHMLSDDYEIILLDDGSIDQTSLVLDNINFLPNLRIVKNQENIGLPASLNRALEMARGRYVVRVDSDDYVSRIFLYMLKTYLNMNRNHQAVAVDYLLVDVHENVLDRCDGLANEIACGVMFRKECLFEVGLYDPSFKMREGHELRKRFASKFSIGRLEFPLYKYRMHDRNRTLDKEQLKLYDERLAQAQSRGE